MTKTEITAENKSASQRFLALLLPTLFMWLLAFDWITRAHPSFQIFTRSTYLLLGLIWIIRRQRKGFQLRIKAIGYLLILYIAYSGILVLEAPLRFHAIEIVVTFIFYLFLFFIFLEDTHSLAMRRAWQFAFLQLAIIFSIFNLFLVVRWWREWTSISESIFQLPPFGYRLPGLFLQHPNYEAAYLNLIIPFILIGILESTNRRLRIGLVSLLLLFLAVIFFASSRGALLGMAGVVGTILLFYFWKPITTFVRQFVVQRRFRLSGQTIIFLIIGVGAIFLFGLLSYQQARFGHGGRLEIWSAAWNIVVDAPLFGHGPGSFHVLSAVQARIPPGFYLVHAHNLLLQIISESGVVGLLILSAVVVLALRSFWRAFQISANNKNELIAYAAVLVGMIAHQLVEFAFEAPLFAVGIIYVLANLSRYEIAMRFELKKNSYINAILFVLLSVYAIGSQFALRGANQQFQGVQEANKGDWTAAQTAICQAQNLNSSLSFYDFQCGFSSAVLANLSGDEQFLRQAHSAYQSGLQKDPFWSLHLAASASITWEMGQREDALLMMRRAQSLSPHSPILALNLAWMFAELKQPDQAQIYLQIAYQLDPWLWRSADDAWKPHQNPLDPGYLQILEKELPPEQYYALIGWLYMDADKADTAFDAFMKALEYNPVSVASYAGLAKYALLQGDNTEAERLLRYADFAGSRSALLEEVKAEFEIQQGRTEEAFEHWITASRLSLWTTSAAPYYAIVYSRAYLPVDFPPQIIQPNLPISVAAGFQKVIEEGTETQKMDAETLLPWFNNQIGMRSGTQRNAP